MIMNTFKLVIGAMAAAIAVSAFSVGAAQDTQAAPEKDKKVREEMTVNAVASVAGAGQLYDVGNGQGLFLGGLAGTIFVDDGAGGFNASEIVCPGQIIINLEDGAQSGEGRCIIKSENGQVFAKWNCKGNHLTGCKGEFELAGGTDWFKGISGKSGFELRGARQEMFLNSLTGDVQEEFLALISWRNFTYRVPR